MQKGFALGWILSDDGSRILFEQNDLAALSDAGAALVRLELRLGTHNAWDSAIIDRYATVLNLLNESDIGVIALIGPAIVAHAQQASWNANSKEASVGGTGDNDFITAYVAAASTLVKQLPQVTHWEIWNEPNAWTSNQGNGVFTGGSFIYPSLYATLLQRTHAAVAASSRTIITGGLFGHNIGGTLSSQSSGADYLHAVYQALAARGASSWPFDGVGQHLYLDQGGPAHGDHLQTVLNYLYAVLVAHEGRGTRRPVYITEAGWPSPPLSQVDQAANLSLVGQVAADNAYVQALCWFQLRDNPAARLYHGVCTADWQRKTAFAAFQAL